MNRRKTNPRKISCIDHALVPLTIQGSYCVRIHTGQRNSRPRDLSISQRNCYALVALHGGSAKVHDGDEARTVLAPAAFLIPPLHPATLDLHAGAQWDLLRFDVTDVPLRFVGEGSKARTHCDPQAQPDPMAVWGITPPLAIDRHAVDECCQVVRLCGSLWWRGEVAWVRANARLQWWLTEYVTGLVAPADAAQTHADPWVKRVLDLARAGIDNGLTVSDLAEQLGMSRVHLRRRLQDAGQPTPKALLLRLRMERAEELLDRTEGKRLTVRNLAGLCGYRSPAAFTRAFERYYGTTPGSWRERR